MDTVNVIYSFKGVHTATVAFAENEEGNKAAEAFFNKCVRLIVRYKPNHIDATVDYLIDNALENGGIEHNGHELVITHSVNEKDLLDFLPKKKA